MTLVVLLRYICTYVSINAYAHMYVYICMCLKLHRCLYICNTNPRLGADTRVCIYEHKYSYNYESYYFLYCSYNRLSN